MPAVPAAGVPLRMPVVGSKVMPDGKVPDSLKVGVGEPVAVRVNEPAVPTENATAEAEVMLGGAAEGPKAAAEGPKAAAAAADRSLQPGGAR